MEDEIFRKRRLEESRKREAQARRKREERERAAAQSRGGGGSRGSSNYTRRDEHGMHALESFPVVGRSAVNQHVKAARAGAAAGEKKREGGGDGGARDNGGSTSHAVVDAVVVASMATTVLPVVDPKVEANKAAAEALRKSLMMGEAEGDDGDEASVAVTETSVSSSFVASVGKRKAEDVSLDDVEQSDTKRVGIDVVAAEQDIQVVTVVDNINASGGENCGTGDETNGGVDELEEVDDDEEDVIEATAVTDLPVIKKSETAGDGEDVEPEDDVRLWETGWKSRYYERKFHVEESNIEFIRQLSWLLCRANVHVSFFLLFF
jgi:5'-3' exoribonuclease 2